MTSHVHMIIGTVGKKLDAIVGEMKSHTSTALRKEIKNHVGESRREWMLQMMEKAGKENGNNNDWQFWQQHNKPTQMQSIEMFHKTLDYIHNNPVEAGFVEKAEDWLYSSAGHFYGKKGLIELSHIV